MLIETCVTEPAGTVGRKGLFPGGPLQFGAINVEIGQCGATPREPNRPGRPTDQEKGIHSSL